MVSMRILFLCSTKYFDWIFFINSQRVSTEQYEMIPECRIKSFATLFNPLNNVGHIVTIQSIVEWINCFKSHRFPTKPVIGITLHFQ